jgi:uncharacterized protein YjbI with pentapeptide repeats
MNKTNQSKPFLLGWLLLIGLLLFGGLGFWWWNGQSQTSVISQLEATPTSRASEITSPPTSTPTTTTTISPTVSLPPSSPAPTRLKTDCLATAGAACAGALNLILTPGLTDLSGINLAGATLSDLSLAGFDLSGAILTGANLSGNFSGTNLKGVSAEEATLNGTFNQVNFSGADLFNATLSGSFNSANFSGANLAEGALEGSYKNASFASAQLVAAFFKNTNLTGANFSGVSNRTIVTFYLTTVICPDGGTSNPRYADLRACRL